MNYSTYFKNNFHNRQEILLNCFFSVRHSHLGTQKDLRRQPGSEGSGNIRSGFSHLFQYMESLYFFLDWFFLHQFDARPVFLDLPLRHRKVLGVRGHASPEGSDNILTC